MLGRGIDQILPKPTNPILHESFIKDARTYVKLAERINGKINYPVRPEYLWGDSLRFIDQLKPDIRLINLETAVTTSEEFWLEKEVHYRLNPENIDVLKKLEVTCCSLANNHTVDWGWRGFEETLKSLGKEKIKIIGAGRSEEESKTPAVIELKDQRRVLIWGLGSGDSGVPERWAAQANRPGIFWIPRVDQIRAREVVQLIKQYKRESDLVVISIHWGGNWGFEVPKEQREFAQILVEEGNVSLVHGHSSHHVKGFEVFRGKLILYGCGDFITDYEGISGFEAFHGNLALLYFPKLNLQDGKLMELSLCPFVVKNFRLRSPTHHEETWLKETLIRESAKLNTHITDSPLINWVGTQKDFG